MSLIGTLLTKLSDKYPGDRFVVRGGEPTITVTRNGEFLLSADILPNLVERLNLIHGSRGDELIAESFVEAAGLLIAPRPAQAIHALRDLQKDIHAVAVEKGWWPVAGSGEPARNMGELLALIHAEVSEAMEDYRKTTVPIGPPSFTYVDGTKMKPAGFWTEIADVVIRCLDLAEAHGVDLGQVIEVKHEYNKTRSYRHGGKKA